MTSKELELEVRELKREVKSLMAHTGKFPVRFPNGGGGGMAIKSYALFPDIPSKPTIIDCKDQAWYANATYGKWKPMVHFTDETGVVGT